MTLRTCLWVSLPFRKTRSTKANKGVAMNVVIRAMITSITKISGGRTPISYPMFKATSSINPRVFINVPTIRLSFQFSPTAFAAKVQPPSLPVIATSMNSKHTHQRLGVFIRPISVRNPVKAKNKGRKNTSARSSTFSIMIFRNPGEGGITTPAMKAPNRAWIPITSVVAAESTRMRKMKPTNDLLMTSEYAYISPIFFRKGRITRNMKAMYTRVRPIV